MTWVLVITSALNTLKKMKLPSKMNTTMNMWLPVNP